MTDERDRDLDRLCAEFRTASSEFLKTLCAGDRLEAGNLRLILRASANIQDVLAEIKAALET